MGLEMRHPEKCVRVRKGALEVNALEFLLDEGVMCASCQDIGEWLTDTLRGIRPVERKPYRYVDAQSRRALAERHGGAENRNTTVTCHCGAVGRICWTNSVPKFVGLDIDHVIPASKGGKSAPNNLQLLCPRCNRSKGARVVA